MTSLNPQAVSILLEKGATFEGVAFGDFTKPRSGEIVFCTAMSGVEESLTDPSFSGQILVSTVSHVGNTGFTGDDMEASKIWAEGLVCRHLETQPSNWRSKMSLPQWIVEQGRYVIEKIDTRALTTELRENGSQRALIYLKDSMSGSEAKAYLQKNVPSMEGLDLTGGVSCSESYTFSDEVGRYWPMMEQFEDAALREHPFEVAVWDFGVKRNTLRILQALHCKVTVMPSTSKAEDLLAVGKDGILLSNGPGDPAAATQVISELKKTLGKRKIFAICLGHQLVALAAGAKTYKMKFGHRGIHHPVIELSERGEKLRTWITSQNHGFAVDRNHLPKGVRVSFEHADDLTVEGLSLPELRCETVQFHPEAAPGPVDSSVLLKNFVRSLGMEGSK